MSRQPVAFGGFSLVLLIQFPVKLHPANGCEAFRPGFFPRSPEPALLGLQFLQHHPDRQLVLEVLGLPETVVSEPPDGLGAVRDQLDGLVDLEGRPLLVLPRHDAKVVGVDGVP